MKHALVSIATGLLFTVLTPITKADSTLPKVTIEHKFATSIDLAWQALGHFCSISEWQSQVKSCVTEERKDGFYRTVVMNDNSAFIERLEEYSTSNHVFTYSIKSGPIPINNYRSEFHLIPVSATETRLIWKAWYTVPSGGDEKTIANNLRSLFANGIQGMVSLLAAPH